MKWIKFYYTKLFKKRIPISDGRYDVYIREIDNQNNGTPPNVYYSYEENKKIRRRVFRYSLLFLLTIVLSCSSNPYKPLKPYFQHLNPRYEATKEWMIYQHKCLYDNLLSQGVSPDSAASQSARLLTDHILDIRAYTEKP